MHPIRYYNNILATSAKKEKKKKKKKKKAIAYVLSLEKDPNSKFVS